MASACPSLYSSRSMPQSSHRHKNGHSHASRKDARKQERTDRKKRKADHFIHNAHSAKRKMEEEHVNSPQRKRMKTSQESISRPPGSESHSTAATKALPRLRPEEPHTTELVQKQKLKTTALERLVNKSAAKPRKVASTGPRGREEEEEDAYIAYLESKLGYTGGGSRRKDDDMDGLGDLFDFTENIVTGMPVSLLHSCALCCV
ncbi:hypothetical protein DFJ58DRAFT_71359 [Suillus subalutaceus]|uniref:uncharacterized protein n=1 Tax=Suillus subalutaceus TaxID=48586 RepID=UPI001B878A64|nr:uncharacterized protein DFJ58DRAFT_71359 [Suillus subalutaceus]KAG1841679.1 hypothetical protein DFJ58DRAFT_71359 [Suillus subalutaceus]